MTNPPYCLYSEKCYAVGTTPALRGCHTCNQYDWQKQIAELQSKLSEVRGCISSYRQSPVTNPLDPDDCVDAIEKVINR